MRTHDALAAVANSPKAARAIAAASSKRLSVIEIDTPCGHVDVTTLNRLQGLRAGDPGPQSNVLFTGGLRDL